MFTPLGYVEGSGLSRCVRLGYEDQAKLSLLWSAWGLDAIGREGQGIIGSNWTAPEGCMQCGSRFGQSRRWHQVRDAGLWSTSQTQSRAKLFSWVQRLCCGPIVGWDSGCALVQDESLGWTTLKVLTLPSSEWTHKLVIEAVKDCKCILDIIWRWRRSSYFQQNSAEIHQPKTEEQKPTAVSHLVIWLNWLSISRTLARNLQTSTFLLMRHSIAKTHNWLHQSSSESRRSRDKHSVCSIQYTDSEIMRLLWSFIALLCLNEFDAAFSNQIEWYEESLCQAAYISRSCSRTRQQVRHCCSVSIGGASPCPNNCSKTSGTCCTKRRGSNAKVGSTWYSTAGGASWSRRSNAAPVRAQWSRSAVFKAICAVQTKTSTQHVTASISIQFNITF